MKVPGGWRIPAVVALAAATSVGVYAVVTDEPEPPDAASRSGPAQYPVAQDLTLVRDEDSGLVQAYCTACHSLAPILRHAGFTPEVWASEVQKMRESYGAPIDDATAKAITAYLQKYYSVPVGELAGTSRQTWSEPSVPPAPEEGS